MDTYVVRIYRPPKQDSRLVLGVVEQVGKNGVLRFSSFDELREILCKGNGRARRNGTEGMARAGKEGKGCGERAAGGLAEDMEGA